MEHRDAPTPQTDISKAQSAQNPAPHELGAQAQPEQAQQQQTETGESQNFETGQADYGSAGEQQAGFGEAGDTQLQQRQNLETGETDFSPQTGEAESGFVGSQSDDEDSENLIERDAE